jgi:hypothetical protein
MYILIGWLNITLLLVMTAPYWLRFLNAHTLHLQGGMYANVIRQLRRVHKPLGGVVLTLALIHGYLALGRFRIHTGTLLWLSIAATALLGLAFFLSKKKAFSYGTSGWSWRASCCCFSICSSPARSII